MHLVHVHTCLSNAGTIGDITSILPSIETFIKNEINSTDIDIISDLCQQSWTIPSDILLTSQRPDLVIVNRTRKSIYILELTVPYERNIMMEHKYKSEKYARLIGDLQDIGWSTSYHAFEVGCRGMIIKENATTLNLFITKISKDVKQKIHVPVLKKISKSLAEVARLCTFSIVHARNYDVWHSPPYLKSKVHTLQ